LLIKLSEIDAAVSARAVSKKSVSKRLRLPGRTLLSQRFPKDHVPVRIRPSAPFFAM
jgi:hypothetical protein